MTDSSRHRALGVVFLALLVLGAYLTHAVFTKKFADYAGDFGGQVDKITFKIYQDTDAAYNDLLAGQIDILDAIPTSAQIDDKYKTDLGDRNAQRETGVIQFIGIDAVASPERASLPEMSAASRAPRDTVAPKAIPPSTCPVERTSTVRRCTAAC